MRIVQLRVLVIEMEVLFLEMVMIIQTQSLTMVVLCLELKREVPRQILIIK